MERLKTFVRPSPVWRVQRNSALYVVEGRWGMHVQSGQLDVSGLELVKQFFGMFGEDEFDVKSMHVPEEFMLSISLFELLIPKDGAVLVVAEAKCSLLL